jgi:hypothetical protein
MILFLSIIGVIFLIFFLSLFIKKKPPLFIVTICLVLGTIYLADQMKYTTFTKLYSKQINEGSVLESVTITVNELIDGIPKGKMQTTIKDEEVIEQIIGDLSELELKKEDHPDDIFLKYEVRFVSTNKIKEDTYQSEFVGVDLDDNYLNNYEIVSDTNHLKAIESIVENKEYEWRDLN